MRRLCTAFALTFGLVAFHPTVALAQDDPFADDDDEIIFDNENEGEEETPERLEDGDDLGAADEQESSDDSLDEFQDSDEDEEILFDDGVDPASTSGDSAAVYRETQENLKNAPPDEQLQAWEQYLEDYPDTPFRERISRRMADLEQELYSGGIGADGQQLDAMESEIRLSQSLQLSNIDPRSRLQAGFEWGSPAYINLLIDYEHALSRTFSAHIGAQQRYTGYNIEFGTKWALVKSSRTNTIVTLVTDAHFNTIPSWLGLRPQLGYGKRLGKVDLTALAGVDLELRSVLGLRLIGGAAATYAASDTVRMFVETNWNMKDLGRDGGFFRFNVVTFGMKFYPGKSEPKTTEVNMGATVPYSTNYWAYHYGSVMVQANKYFE